MGEKENDKIPRQKENVMIHKYHINALLKFFFSLLTEKLMFRKVSEREQP